MTKTPDTPDAPARGTLLKRLPRGVELRSLAPGNERWLLENLRDGDRAEHESALTECAQRGIDPAETRLIHAFAVWTEGRLVGIFSSHLFAGDSILATRRCWAFQTSREADRFPVRFARSTPAVFAACWEAEPAHVTEAYALAWQGYGAAMRWLTRRLRAKPCSALDVGGEPHRFYRLDRPQKEDAHV